MDASKQLLCLLLHTQPRLGLSLSEALLQRFPSAQLFWSAPGSDLPLCSRPAANNALLELHRAADKGAPWQQARNWQLQMQQQHIQMLCPQDAEYPLLLRDIVDRPAALYVRGDISALARPQIAVVGSRNASRGGLQIAVDFARELAAAGLCVTSGLALGIDGAAHRGALQGSGVTVAVLGTGIDRIYPRRHQALADEILSRGALVSEFALGSEPLPRNFPRRNRILAGSSVGTLVVEAAVGSGSLITARLALDYNREVFALPGSIHNPNAKGNHKLIREGAKLVDTTTHIFEELGALLQLLAADVEVAKQSRQSAQQQVLAPHLAAVLEVIDYHATAFDTIAERSGIDSAELSGYLLELELAQWLECSAGSWQRCR